MPEFRVVVEDAEAFLATFDSLAADCRRLLGTTPRSILAHTGTAPWRATARTSP